MITLFALFSLKSSCIYTQPVHSLLVVVQPFIEKLHFLSTVYSQQVRDIFDFQGKSQDKVTGEFNLTYPKLLNAHVCPLCLSTTWSSLTRNRSRCLIHELTNTISWFIWNWCGSHVDTRRRRHLTTDHQQHLAH